MPTHVAVAHATAVAHITTATTTSPGPPEGGTAAVRRAVTDAGAFATAVDTALPAAVAAYGVFGSWFAFGCVRLIPPVACVTASWHP